MAFSPIRSSIRLSSPSTFLVACDPIRITCLVLVLLAAGVDTGVTSSASEIPPMSFYIEMYYGSVVSPKLITFSGDMKLMWKATEMIVNLYEYLSCTDSSTVKHWFSLDNVPSEIRLVYGLMCKKCM